jgi:hypothetical protein
VIDEVWEEERFGFGILLEKKGCKSLERSLSMFGKHKRVPFEDRYLRRVSSFVSFADELFSKRKEKKKKHHLQLFHSAMHLNPIVLEKLPEDAYHIIEYPGIVKNSDKAIETLGGRNAIEDAFRKEELGCLQLNYQPEDKFSHAINGDNINTSDLVVCSAFQLIPSSKSPAR